MDFLISENIRFEDGIYRDNRNYRDDISDEFEKIEDVSFWHKHRSECIQPVSSSNIIIESITIYVKDKKENKAFN